MKKILFVILAGFGFNNACYAETYIGKFQEFYSVNMEYGSSELNTKIPDNALLLEKLDDEKLKISLSYKDNENLKAFDGELTILKNDSSSLFASNFVTSIVVNKNNHFFTLNTMDDRSIDMISAKGNIIFLN